MTGNNVTFVRDSATPKDYDGVWQVWVGVHCYGYVQRGPDPLKKSEAWGYRTKPTKRYPNGQRCLYGFPTRKAAGAALIKATEEATDHDRPHAPRST